MIRQAAVVGLSLIPFGLSVATAYLAWSVFPEIEGWHMIVTVLVWVTAFAAGTQLFWSLVERLAPTR